MDIAIFSRNNQNVVYTCIQGMFVNDWMYTVYSKAVNCMCIPTSSTCLQSHMANLIFVYRWIQCLCTLCWEFLFTKS